jgi:hypothetical protein
LRAGPAEEAISNQTDCFEPSSYLLKSFMLTIKAYMYPATIEFSVTCATIFMIMWYRIGKTNNKNYTLLPINAQVEGVGKIEMPYSNLFIMLDCTKTSKGLFFGVIVFVGTLLSFIVFIVYNSNKETKQTAKLISEVTEIALLLIALIITLYALLIVRYYYSKAIPQTNMFDIALEIFSLFGVYAFSINSLIAVFYSFFSKSPEKTPIYFFEYLGLDSLASSRSVDINENALSVAGASGGGSGGGHGSGSQDGLAIEITAAIASILSIAQGTFQTLFILECLRRYALHNEPFMRKPARELITALLLTNVSMWFFDTFSAKRFETKPFLLEHFGILKWSIINAFSSPIAIFYRFHSSVCLSDIWYGLYYGEYEKEEEEEEDGDEDEEEENSLSLASS